MNLKNHYKYPITIGQVADHWDKTLIWIYLQDLLTNFSKSKKQNNFKIIWSYSFAAKAAKIWNFHFKRKYLVHIKEITNFKSTLFLNSNSIRLSNKLLLRVIWINMRTIMPIYIKLLCYCIRRPLSLIFLAEFEIL